MATIWRNSWLFRKSRDRNLADRALTQREVRCHWQIHATCGGAQFLGQVAHALGHARGGSQILGVGSEVGLGLPSDGALPSGDPSCLPLDPGRLLSEAEQDAVKPRLILGIAVPEMLPVDLAHHLGGGLLTGGVHRDPFAYHHLLPRQSPVRQAPQDQGSALRVYG